MEEKKLFDFEHFEIYQRAERFTNMIYKLTSTFPNIEQFVLCSQLKRSALSIILNLAEGFGKYHKNDKIRYYRIARASTHECVTALKISFKQHFLDKNRYETLYHECFELSRRIAGLIKSIQKRQLKNNITSTPQTK